MRDDPAAFAAANTAPWKSPRVVVAIIFETNSLYFTSHGDIPNVPGVVQNWTVLEPSVVSQRLNPDQGRAEIGSASFRLVDKGGATTANIRSRLAAGAGLRNRTVKFWMGYEGLDFSQFVLFQTQIVTGVTYDAGVYDIQCADIQRETRKDIFDLAQTNLTAAVGIADTTITVASTAAFALLAHGVTYTDAPSSTVGYVKIGSEIIRYTGKTSTTFTGCTRGVLGTKAAAYTVDTSVPVDRREKVTEHVYLELPAVQLIYALLTGVLHGEAATLPTTWHLGIDPSWVRLADFTGIGRDLWDTTTPNNSVIVRFAGVTKTGGKAFIEKELLLLLAVFMPVYSDGALGLRRMTRVLRDAAPVVTLTDANIVDLGPLEHDLGAMQNAVRIDWNHNGKEFTRQNLFVDATSVSTHGKAETEVLPFRGLYGNKQTDVTIRNRADAFRDRYAAPPQRLRSQVLPSLNRLGVGDVVRLVSTKLRDFAAPSGVTGIDRAFEVQQVSYNVAQGNLSLELFGSTVAGRGYPATSATTVLVDGFYTAQGTNLATLPGVVISGGVMTSPPSSVFTGSTSDISSAGATLYYDGDLTIGAGVVLQIAQNVQLRVKGFLQVNGEIRGKGAGRAGVVDDGTVNEQGGVNGYVGNTRAWDGIRISQRSGNPVMETRQPVLNQALPAFPPLTLGAASTSPIVGVPPDLRGGGGGPGGKLLYQDARIGGASGAGGAGGAGLMIVARGMALGAAGKIDLSGNDGALGGFYDYEDKRWYAGSGAGGAPGALLIVLDGSAHSWPDLEGKYVARTGVTPTPTDPEFGVNRFLDGGPAHRYNRNEGPFAGNANPAIVSYQDLSFSALRIHYMPEPVVPQPDVAAKPPAPTNLLAYGDVEFIGYKIGTPPPFLFDYVELWTSLTNDRSAATGPITFRGDEAGVFVPSGGERYAWARTVRLDETVGPVASDWFPSSATAGVWGKAIPRPMPGASLNPDPNFENPRAWVDTSGNALPAARFVTITDGVTGNSALRSASGAQLFIEGADRIPIDPAKAYRVRARIRASTNLTQRLYLGVDLRDSAGAVIAGDGSWWSYGAASYRLMPNVWTGVSFVFGAGTAKTFPSNGRTIQPLALLNYDSAAGYMEVQDFRIEEATPTDLLAPNATYDFYTYSAATSFNSGSVLTGFQWTVALIDFIAPVDGYFVAEVTARPVFNLGNSVKCWIEVNTDSSTLGSSYALGTAGYVRSDGDSYNFPTNLQPFNRRASKAISAGQRGIVVVRGFGPDASDPWGACYFENVFLTVDLYKR